jgi:hypothetical protein
MVGSFPRMNLNFVQIVLFIPYLTTKLNQSCLSLNYSFEMVGEGGGERGMGGRKGAGEGRRRKERER